MQANEKILQQDGFTIVEVLVAAGLLTLVAAGMMTFMRFIGSSDRGTRQMAEARDLRVELRSLLNDDTSCTGNLQGIILNETSGGLTPVQNISYIQTNPVTTPLTKVTPPWLVPGTHYRDANSILVNQINLYYKAKLGDIPPLPVYLANPPPPPTSEHAIDVQVIVSRTNEVVGAIPITIRIPVVVTVLTSSRAILNCHANPISIGENHYEDVYCQLNSFGSLHWVPDPSGVGGSCQPICFNGPVTPPSDYGGWGPDSGSCDPNTMMLANCTVTGPVQSGLWSGPRSYMNPLTGKPLNPPSAVQAFAATAVPSTSNPDACSCWWLPSDTGGPGYCTACCSTFNLNSGW